MESDWCWNRPRVTRSYGWATIITSSSGHFVVPAARRSAQWPRARYPRLLQFEHLSDWGYMANQRAGGMETLKCARVTDGSVSTDSISTPWLVLLERHYDIDSHISGWWHYRCVTYTPFTPHLFSLTCYPCSNAVIKPSHRNADIHNCL